MKLRNTIQFKLLLPIVLLLLVAAACIGAVSLYVFDTNNRQSELGAQALQASHHAHNANQVVGKIDTLVQETLDMVSIKSEAHLRTRFESFAAELNVTLNALRATSQEPEILEQISSLESETNIWIKNVRLLLGLDKSNQIPTRFAFSKQTQKIASKSLEISMLTEDVVQNHSENSRNEFKNGLLMVAALTLGLLATITIYLFSRIKSIGVSMTNLASSMTEIVDGNLDLAVQGQDRKDEVGQMARNLSKFASDLSELDHVKKEKFLLSHDVLTGLANRRLFTERLEQELMDHANRGNLIVALIDLDNFKFINDTMGHDAGDALLVELSNRFQKIADRCNGLVARFGGDEFAMIARTGTSYQNAEELGEFLLSKIAIRFQFNSNLIQPGCSIGFANVEDLETPVISDALKAADVALYEAKASGKARFQVYDESIKALHIRQQNLAENLKSAIRGGEINASYQPKICLNTGAMVGVEALARWQMNGEWIEPEEFVTIAERTGLIRSMDMQVLKSAAEFSVEVYGKTGERLAISSNMSAQHFLSEDIVSNVQKILKQTGLPPSYYTLEITENSAVENWDAVVSTLAKLRMLGIKISIDDFGTGYSSLSYLQRFKFDEIKIDKEFVNRVDENDDSLFLFSSIINMAKGLGSKIVVEGIETSQQGIFAKQAGGHIGQGFLFGKPLSRTDALAYVERIELSAVA